MSNSGILLITTKVLFWITQFATNVHIWNRNKSFWGVLYLFVSNLIRTYCIQVLNIFLKLKEATVNFASENN